MPHIEFAKFCYFLSGIGLFQTLWTPCSRKQLQGALIATILSILVTQASLFHAGMVDDRSLQYISTYGAHGDNIFLNIGLLWAGQSGANLILILGVSFGAWSALNALTPSAKISASVRWYIATHICGLMFLEYWISSPFLRNLPFPPEQSGSLNPLLRSEILSYHPPLLLASTAFFFSVAVFDLFHTEKPHFLLRKKLIECGLWGLSLGMLAGAYWAYHVLGWGGWWFWDPIETISMVTWLGGMILLHQRQPGFFDGIMLFSCICLQLFCVRANLIQSVHSFVTDWDLLPWTLFGLYGLLYLLWRILKKPIIFQRESAATVGLSGMLALTFWGLWSPILSTYFQKISFHLSPHFFESNLSLIIFLTFIQKSKNQNMIKAYSMLLLICWIVMPFLSALTLGLLLSIHVIFSSDRGRSKIAHLLILMLMGVSGLQRALSWQREFSVGQDILIDHQLIHIPDRAMLQEHLAEYEISIFDQLSQKTHKIFVKKIEDSTSGQMITPIVYWHQWPGHDYGFCWGYDENSIRIFYRPYMQWIWFFSAILIFYAFSPISLQPFLTDLNRNRLALKLKKQNLFHLIKL